MNDEQNYPGNSSQPENNQPPQDNQASQYQQPQYQQPQYQQPYPPQEQPKNKMGAGKIVLIVLAIIVGLIIIGNLFGGDDNPTTNPSNTVRAGESTTNGAASKAKFSEADVKTKLEVKELSYEDSIKTAWVFLVIKNNSDFDLSISATLNSFNEGGDLVGVKNEKEQAFAKGTEIVLSFMTDGKSASTKYELSVKEEAYYTSVIQNISYETTLVKGKAIVSTTNNGNLPAEFVEGTALFYSGDKLVGHDTRYFTGDDSDLKPAETISKEMSCYEDFDSVKVYFTGRN